MRMDACSKLILCWRPDCSFADLTILIPVKHPHNLPFRGSVPDALAEEVEWDCPEKNGPVDSGHGTECLGIPILLNPRVGVE
jgi:hypothetical protein